MPRDLIIRTPENVEITHSLAGLGSRFIALLIDHLLQIAVGLVVLFAAAYAASGIHGLSAVFDESFNLSGWVLAALVAFFFLLFWGYFIFFETVWNGQTPGKQAVNIRVIREDGRPLDFFSAAARNIARIIDMMPPISYAVGVVTIFFSPTYKRVGDYLAGTVVVKEYWQARRRTERKPSRPAEPPADDRIEASTSGRSDEGSDGYPSGSDSNLWGWDRPSGHDADEEVIPEEAETMPGVTVPSISQVTRDEYEAARRFLDRRGELPSAVAEDLARRIALPVLARLGMSPEDPDCYPYETFLETLAQDYLRWQDRRYS